ncbi:hypothetical protein B9479_008149 [Cryptococcus floricola]|uniref:C2H2-type domain-containing protein n=1 Tax=Cryptococcus floricola TaxID=2591691 RepID=A0A5D3AI78_9TREE|nr:hypothetical protein B9479_008149 [Cryptococcus floricola]
MRLTELKSWYTHHPLLCGFPAILLEPAQSTRRKQRQESGNFLHGSTRLHRQQVESDRGSTEHGRSFRLVNETQAGSASIRILPRLKQPDVPPIASVPVAITQDEPDSDPDDDDDISSDEDDDDCPDDDDTSSDELDDGYVKCIEAEEMDRSSLPAAKDDFWLAYLINPLETYASRLNPLARCDTRAPGGASGLRPWEQAPELLLDCLPHVQKSQEPPSIDEIRAIVDANGMCCNEDGDRLDELEGRGEAQHRSLGAYWKVAFPVAADDEDDAEDGEEDVGAVEPLPVLLYTGQTATVKPTGKTMGFRTRWRMQARDVYVRDRVLGRDSLFTRRFMKSQRQYRMAFAAIVAVPVPKGTELNIPFRNAVKFFARLSEAVLHEAFDTVYHATNSRRTRTHRTFWVDGPQHYVGTNAQDPLQEEFTFWELDKPQRPYPKCSLCDKVFTSKSCLDIHVRTGW